MKTTIDQRLINVLCCGMYESALRERAEMPWVPDTMQSPWKRLRHCCATVLETPKINDKKRRNKNEQPTESCARALAEFTGELLDEIFYIERLNAEIDADTPDYEQARRRDLLEKAKIMGEVIAWLLK